jgi:hypothetical protein
MRESHPDSTHRRCQIRCELRPSSQEVERVKSNTTLNRRFEAALVMLGLSLFHLPVGWAAEAVVPAPIQARINQMQQAEQDLQQAEQEAWNEARAQTNEVRASDRAWAHKRLGDCAGTLRPIPPRVLAADPAKFKCYMDMTQERVAAFRRLIVEAKAGAVSPTTMKTLKGPFVLAPLPPTNQPTSPPAAAAVVPATPAEVNPFSGTGGKIERNGQSAFLSYTDASGATHRYAVMRPKFAQSMLANTDTGAWIYVAEDRQSGTSFNMAASGQVTGSPLNPVMLRMATSEAATR